MRNKKTSPNQQPPLRLHILRAQKALKSALGHADWLLVGDLSDGPVVGALLDDAAAQIYYAREELTKLLGRRPQEGVQTELTLLADLELDFDESGLCAVAHDGPCPNVAPCATCGHATRDHAEGLRCLTCGCTTYGFGEAR